MLPAKRKEIIKKLSEYKEDDIYATLLQMLEDYDIEFSTDYEFTTKGPCSRCCQTGKICWRGSNPDPKPCPTCKGKGYRE